jgi:phage baseplate assembly protein W
MAIIERLYKDIDLNFLPHPDTGDIGKKVDINAVKQAVLTLLLTKYFERPFQPLLASPIYQLLFEPLDPITAASMKQSIERVLQNYEPRVTIRNLDVLPDFDNNAFIVTLYADVIGLRDPIQFSTTLQRLR